MAKEMLINVSEGEECRIALLENGKLEELYMERTSSTSHVGNIYKGRVTNVEPSIQAAFVDFGMGRNGFLHISDLMPTYFGKAGEEIQEAVGRKIARRDRPPIQRCLRRGDEIVVQIIKEGIGTKGPTLSTYVSIPGRILVMMPGMTKFGVSRKIEDEDERRRLRQILDSLKPVEDVGFIIRTAGVGKSKTEIERDLKYLTRLWETLKKKRDSSPAPVELYTEGDLVTRTVRDVYTADVERIVVDSKEVAKKIREFFKIAMPRTKNKIELYEEPIPLFHKYNIEPEIEKMYSRHVPLPSGGSLVIDSTEAIVAIDVNSGKFREHSDAEMTAFKTDLEAADEIPRQLKLRDLGGVIICDFIDLRYERHRREVERRLHENLKKDRAKTKVLRMSQFGIIEMTRQRMRPSLKRSIYFDCPHCKGAGLVKTPESMSLDVMRRLTIAAHDPRVVRVHLAVCPDVAEYLLNKKRAALTRLEADSGKKIIVRQNTSLALDEIKLELFDARDGLVMIPGLGITPPEQVSGQQAQPSGRDKSARQDRRQQRSGRQHRQEELSEMREELLDSAQAAVELQEQRDQDVSDARPAPVLASAPASQKQLPSISQTEDIENGFEPLGEAPQAMDEEEDRRGGRRRRRGRRGGRGRDRNGSSTDPTSPPNGDELAEVESQVDPAPLATSEEHPPTVIEQSPMADAAGSSDAPTDASSTDEQQAAPRKRRRRRGGRRHRRRREREAALEQPSNGASNAEPPLDESDLLDSEELADSLPLPESHSTPAGQDTPSGSSSASVIVEQGESDVQPPPEKKRPIRSGKSIQSADKHLADDEPVIHEPILRPRSRRDLDYIPDDFD